MEFDVTKEKQLAIRYWERRRWLFLALLVPSAIFFYISATDLAIALGNDPRLTTTELYLRFLLAFIGANICYSFAYVVEFFFFGSPRFKQYAASGRTTLFVLGCALGMILAGGVARGIALKMYP